MGRYMFVIQTAMEYKLECTEDHGNENTDYNKSIRFSKPSLGFFLKTTEVGIFAEENLPKMSFLVIMAQQISTS